MELSKDVIPEEFLLLAPYLLEMSVSSNGVYKELVFYFPEPSPLKLDLRKISEDWRYEVDGVFSEPELYRRVIMPQLIGKKVTIASKGYDDVF